MGSRMKNYQCGSLRLQIMRLGLWPNWQGGMDIYNINKLNLQVKYIFLNYISFRFWSKEKHKWARLCLVFLFFWGFFLPPCMMLSYLHTTSCTGLPNEPYVAVLIVHLIPCYSLFPKKVQSCQVISPAELKRSLTMKLICYLSCEFPMAGSCVVCKSFSFFQIIWRISRDL